MFVDLGGQCCQRQRSATVLFSEMFWGSWGVFQEVKLLHFKWGLGGEPVMQENIQLGGGGGGRGGIERVMCRV